MSKNKKKKFSQQWISQTNLGKLFGISAIAVGGVLIAEGLKDGKSATKKALDDGYASSTPLKDGTPFFMWNVDKVKPLVNKRYEKLSEKDLLVNELKRSYQAAQEFLDEGNKLGYFIYDSLYDEVPKKFDLEEIKKLVEGKD